MNKRFHTMVLVLFASTISSCRTRDSSALASTVATSANFDKPICSGTYRADSSKQTEDFSFASTDFAANKKFSSGSFVLAITYDGSGGFKIVSTNAFGIPMISQTFSVIESNDLEKRTRFVQSTANDGKLIVHCSLNPFS